MWLEGGVGRGIPVAKTQVIWYVRGGEAAEMGTEVVWRHQTTTLVLWRRASNIHVPEKNSEHSGLMSK